MSEQNQRTSKRVILDLGRQKKKSIRELRQGTGPLAQEAARAVAGEQETDGKEVVPVAILYRKRGRKLSRKRRGLLGEILRRL